MYIAFKFYSVNMSCMVGCESSPSVSKNNKATLNTSVLYIFISLKYAVSVKAGAPCHYSQLTKFQSLKQKKKAFKIRITKKKGLTLKPLI